MNRDKREEYLVIATGLRPAAEAEVREQAGAYEDVCEVVYVDESRVREVEGRMPDAETIGQVTDVFKVLGDPTRARIVLALSQAELCVCDLAALVGLSVSAVSHQLRLLRSLGLVTFRKEGRLVYYSLEDDGTAQLLQTTMDRVRRASKEG